VEKPECGRYLRQSQPTHSHGSFAGGGHHRRRSPLTCRKQFSALALRLMGSGYLTRWGDHLCSIFRICSSGIGSSNPPQPKRAARRRKNNELSIRPSPSPSKDLMFLGRFRGNRVTSYVPTFAVIPTTPEEDRQWKQQTANKVKEGKRRAALVRQRRSTALEIFEALPAEQRRDIKLQYRADRRRGPTPLYQEWLVKHLTLAGLLK
jgi:hypothetical protein